MRGQPVTRTHVQIYRYRFQFILTFPRADRPYIRDRLDAITSAVRYSPRAHIAADHSKSSDVMQKKLIDCPISSHDPW
jgi:hypothetical protein